MDYKAKTKAVLADFDAPFSEVMERALVEAYAEGMAAGRAEAFYEAANTPGINSAMLIRLARDAKDAALALPAKPAPDDGGRKMLEKVKELEKTMPCTCDLDRWEPEKSTGHSCVCGIHKAALDGGAGGGKVMNSTERIRYVGPVCCGMMDPSGHQCCERQAGHEGDHAHTTFWPSPSKDGGKDGAGKPQEKPWKT